MTEFTAREPHWRMYQAEDGKVGEYWVNNLGVISISEEAFHNLLTKYAGFTEVTILDDDSTTA